MELLSTHFSYEYYISLFTALFDLPLKTWFTVTLGHSIHAIWKVLEQICWRAWQRIPNRIWTLFGGRVFYRKTEIFQTFMAANRCAISQKSLCVWDIYLPSLNTRDTKWKSTYKLGVLSIRIFAAFIHSAHDSVSPPLLAILFAVRTLFPPKKWHDKVVCIFCIWI